MFELVVFCIDTVGLKLTPDEASTYYQLFQIADSEGSGIINASAAVAFLTKSQLAQNVLGEVSLWDI